MKAEELLKDMQEHDLVAIENDDKKVHLVRLDEQSQLSICRTTMITDGTTHNHNNNTEWEILGNCSDVQNYEHEVTKRERQPCENCLSWMRKKVLTFHQHKC